MIYYVELRVNTRDSITKLIPAKSAIRVQLKMIKQPTDETGLKARMLVGWLTQKQFDAMVEHCGLTAGLYKSVHLLEDNGWIPKMTMYDTPHGANIYHAFVSIVPQKFKRSSRVNRKPTTLYVHRRQWKRLAKAFRAVYRHKDDDSES